MGFLPLSPKFASSCSTSFRRGGLHKGTLDKQRQPLIGFSKYSSTHRHLRQDRETVGTKPGTTKAGFDIIFSLRGTPPGQVSVAMAGILTRGSQLSPTFPDNQPSGLSWGRSPHTVAGAVTELAPFGYTAPCSHFISSAFGFREPSPLSSQAYEP